MASTNSTSSNGLPVFVLISAMDSEPNMQRTYLSLLIFYQVNRAYHTAKDLPLQEFEPDSYLKISGIAICLAEVFEEDGKTEQAFNVYLDSLTRLQDVERQSRGNPQLSGSSNEKGFGDAESLGKSGQFIRELTDKERLRAITLAYKLAELAGRLNRPEDQERYLVWTAETIIRMMQSETEKIQQSSAMNSPKSNEAELVIRELSLPIWATKTDFAAPFEALGTFYSQNDRLEYAMPLYLQAISILIPSSPESPQASIEDRCRAAQLMSNLSELLIRARYRFQNRRKLDPLTSTAVVHSDGDMEPAAMLTQAEKWAVKALELSKNAREEGSKKQQPDPTCEVAFAVALFNVATLRRIRGDKTTAKTFFMQSLEQSKTIGLREGMIHAEDALRNLERGCDDIDQR